MNNKAVLIKKSSNRIIFYDLIKIIAAFMVCFYHLGLLNLGFVKNTPYFPNFNSLIMNLCSMSVPLFFMVNGALILSKNYSIKQTVIKFVKIVFLYVFWMVALTIITKLFLTQKLDFSITNALKTNSYNVHMWFFRTLAILTIISPIIKKIYEKNIKIIYVGIIGLFCFPFLYNYIILIGRWLNVDFFEKLNRTGFFTMYSILYYIFGKIISDKINGQKLGIKKKILSFMSVLLGWIFVTLEVVGWTNLNNRLFDGVNGSFPTVGALLLTVGTFILLSQISLDNKIRIKKAITFVSSNIMGVYIFHMIFVLLIKKHMIIQSSMILAVALVILIMVISIIITWVLKKIPVVKEVLNI